MNGYLTLDSVPLYLQKSVKPVFTIPKDGVFLFIAKIELKSTDDFKAVISIQIKGEHGYLSATEYPLLIVRVLPEALCGGIHYMSSYIIFGYM